MYMLTTHLFGFSGGVKNYLEFGKKKGSCHFRRLYAVRVEAASSCIKLELFLCRCCVQHCCSYVQHSFFFIFFFQMC